VKEKQIIHKERLKMKEYTEMAKKTFNIWDIKEKGCLSANDLISAFIKIGLSEDINFAKQIVNKI
jgi:hypothetical protein